jgi:hypothetical protein
VDASDQLGPGPAPVGTAAPAPLISQFALLWPHIEPGVAGTCSYLFPCSRLINAWVDKPRGNPRRHTWPVRQPHLGVPSSGAAMCFVTAPLLLQPTYSTDQPRGSVTELAIAEAFSQAATSGPAQISRATPHRGPSPPALRCPLSEVQGGYRRRSHTILVGVQEIHFTARLRAPGVSLSFGRQQYQRCRRRPMSRNPSL